MLTGVALNRLVVAEVVLFRILSVILQLVFLKIYSNYLSIYEIGLYYLFITISYSLNAFLLVPLDFFQQSKLYSLKDKNQSLRSFSFINIFILKASFLTLIVVEFIIWFFDKDSMLVVLLMFILSVLIYFSLLMRGWLNNLNYRRNAIYTLFAESILKIGFFVSLVYFFQATSLLLLASMVASMLVINIVLYFLISRKSEYNKKNKCVFSLNEILVFSYPISFAAIINWIQTQGYRIILAPMGYMEIIGIYATVSKIGESGMSAVSSVYNQLFIPDLYKSNGEFILKYIVAAIIVIVIVLIVGVSFSKEIVELLTNENFSKYSLIITYGILAESGNLIIGGLSIYLTIHSLTKKILLSALIGIVSFSVSFLLLYMFYEVSIWTIGGPIILSQLLMIFYLFYVVYIRVRNNA